MESSWLYSQLSVSPLRVRSNRRVMASCSALSPCSYMSVPPSRHEGKHHTCQRPGAVQQRMAGDSPCPQTTCLVRRTPTNALRGRSPGVYAAASTPSTPPTINNLYLDTSP